MRKIQSSRSAAVLASLILLFSCSSDVGEPGLTGPEGPPGTDGLDGTDGQDGNDGQDGSDGQTGPIRLATVPSGAEVTGLFLSESGDLFFNVQHPSDANDAVHDVNARPFNKGTVGVIRGIDFNHLPTSLISSPVPISDFEKQTVVAAIGEYQILGQTGDTFEGLLPEGLGVHYGINTGEKIIENNNPDFNGFIQTGLGEGYLFSNWEAFPGGVSRIKITKNADSSWEVTEAMMVNFDNVAGTAANCFGSVSPWGTPLTSEEWVVNSTMNTTTSPSWNDPANTNSDGIEALTFPDFPNPYRYGYIAEVTDPTGDAPQVVKHYTIGRYEHENATVMADRRTVYASQDDTGGVLFKFIADTPEDLSSGTLYAAKLTQDDSLTDPAVTGFDVTWIKLGSGSNTVIEAWIAEYDGIDTSDYVEGKTSYLSIADIQAWADGQVTYPTESEGGSPVTTGLPMDDRAVFLESRQAARLKGATAEWRKLEGISINHDRVLEAVGGVDAIDNEDLTQAFLYLAVSDIDDTMIDSVGDIQLSNRVEDCGGIYRARIESDYSVSRIEPVVMGSTYRRSLDGALRCDVDQLSQPDNVIVMKDGRIIIGEDGFQENNTLWLFDPTF